MNASIEDLNILICDDSLTNVAILSKLLESEGFNSIKTLTEPLKVLPTLESKAFDILLLDIEMPHIDGFGVMQQIADTPSICNQLIPIMVLTASQAVNVRNRALEAGAQDFLPKPFDQTEVILRVKNLLRVRAAYLAQKNLAIELERKVAARTVELNHATDILIERMAMAGEMRDNETGKHVLRVGRYARILSDGAGLPPEIGYLMEKAAPLHDLGKIGIPDSILLKKDKLNAAERQIMNGHAELGANLLAQHESMLVQMAATIALSHHECWDGNGYPFGLQGDSIPIEGRITAISDVFDALTTARPYKEAWSIPSAVDYIISKSGTQFDPALIQIFEEKLDNIIEIRMTYDDEIRR